MNGKRRTSKLKLSDEQRLLLIALGSGLPGSFVGLLLLWTNDYSAKVQWTLSALITGGWLGCALALRERIVRYLQTLSNLLAALREGDYSIRARKAQRSGAIGDAMLEVNSLGEHLRRQRLGALEATALLRTVMAEIEVAIFAFDDAEKVRLVNQAGARLLGQTIERLLGRSAQDLNLDEYLRGDMARTVQRIFPGGAGRWGVRRRRFREQGVPHTLLVIADLSRALREEEREAWQRLLRVLGHELNNSLAPISSIAGSLESLLVREPRPTDWREDMQRGLTVIGGRSAALRRFMQSYSRLARLPRPRFAALDISSLIKRVVELETRLDVELRAGAPVLIQADGDQLEQLLINVLRNAVDAALETGGGVVVSWTRMASQLEVVVADEGPGLAATSNLFVPFFTTKPGGNGIGLVLSRQIAEAHNGTLTLENRAGGLGCEARLRLPL